MCGSNRPDLPCLGYSHEKSECAGCSWPGQSRSPLLFPSPVPHRAELLGTSILLFCSVHLPLKLRMKTHRLV